jgi:hypothetical protein
VEGTAARPADRPLSLVDEIRRVDDLATSVFEVCMAAAAGAVAVVFAVDNSEVQIGAAVIGFVLAFSALVAVPDVVLGWEEPDLGQESLRRILKNRQRRTQGAILVLITVVNLCLIAGVAVLGGVSGYGAAVAVACGGVFGALPVALLNRGELWPKAIRGRVPRR